jgi:hypothetical protein
MDETPHLVMTDWVRGTPVVYQCSLCRQKFMLPEDRTPRDAMVEVWAAFSDHVRENHPDSGTG